MVSTIIFDIIVGILFIFLGNRMRVIRIIQHRQSQPTEKKYLMANVYYSIILLCIARILEAAYILTETDAKAILIVGLRIHIPLDTIAMAIFFSVCADGFYTYELETRREYRKWLLILVWLAIVAGWTRIYIEMIKNNVIERDYFESIIKIVFSQTL
mgnify:CR=1 FL=1